MPIAQAEIQTERASRYLVQFCKHAAAMDGGGHLHRIHLHEPLTRREVQVAAEWSDTTGTVTFTPWGQATLTADDGILTVRVDAADDDGLAQIRDVITRDLERFSGRDPLTVTWQRLETASTVPIRDTGAPAPKPRRRFSRTHLQTILLALAVAGVIGLHVGLAGAVVAQSPWTGVATNVLVALIVLKIALVAVARHGIRAGGPPRLLQRKLTTAPPLGDVDGGNCRTPQRIVVPQRGSVAGRAKTSPGKGGAPRRWTSYGFRP